jgi:hypothetical protein
MLRRAYARMCQPIYPQRCGEEPAVYRFFLYASSRVTVEWAECPRFEADATLQNSCLPDVRTPVRLLTALRRWTR